MKLKMNVRYIILITCLLFSALKLKAQNCLGGADIIQGKAGMTYVKSIGTNRLVIGGLYYAASGTNNIIGTDTITSRPGDLLTIYAAVTDSNLNLIRMFNVIGFNDMGGAFSDTRVYDMHADTLGNIYFSGSFAQDTLVSYFGDTVYSDGYQEHSLFAAIPWGQPPY